MTWKLSFYEALGGYAWAYFRQWDLVQACIHFCYIWDLLLRKRLSLRPSVLRWTFLATVMTPLCAKWKTLLLLFLSLPSWIFLVSFSLKPLCGDSELLLASFRLTLLLGLPDLRTRSTKNSPRLRAKLARDDW